MFSHTYTDIPDWLIYLFNVLIEDTENAKVTV